MIDNKAEEILNKFNKEMLHELIKKMFEDRIINENDLDFTYYDASNIKILIPITNFRTKKPDKKIIDVNVTISIDIMGNTIDNNKE
jgi:hypothetical protein